MGIKQSTIRGVWQLIQSKMWKNNEMKYGHFKNPYYILHHEYANETTREYEGIFDEPEDKIEITDGIRIENASDVEKETERNRAIKPKAVPQNNRKEGTKKEQEIISEEKTDEVDDIETTKENLKDFESTKISEFSEDESMDMMEELLDKFEEENQESIYGDILEKIEEKEELQKASEEDIQEVNGEEEIQEASEEEKIQEVREEEIQKVRENEERQESIKIEKSKKTKKSQKSKKINIDKIMQALAEIKELDTLIKASFEEIEDEKEKERKNTELQDKMKKVKEVIKE